MQIMNIGANGLTDISVKSDDKKNDLPIGTVFQLNGYSNPQYVVVENMGIDAKYMHYGAKYKLVHLTDFTFKQEHACHFDHIDTQKDNRIHMYYTDEVLTEDQTADILKHAKSVELETQIRREEAKQKADEQEAKGRELFRKYIPADAIALIVAEHEHDECDSMTDYFATSTSGLVVLGWSKHKRDIFSEMRKHAHKIPETEHLAVKPDKDQHGDTDEHREKYSMGAGYYLKAANRYSTGWKIEKMCKYGEDWDRSTYIAMAERCIFTDTEAQTAPDQAKSETLTDNSPPADDSTAGREAPTISKYKGHPTISLPMSGKGFCFGINKAKTILDYIDEIKQFVEDN